MKTKKIFGAPVVLLWEEDRQVPDRERPGEAWKRLFGRELSQEKKLQMEDRGDVVFWEHEGGLIYAMTYEGAKFYRFKTVGEP